jgi:hypothetical protein
LFIAVGYDRIASKWRCPLRNAGEESVDGFSLGPGRLMKKDIENKRDVAG